MWDVHAETQPCVTGKVIPKDRMKYPSIKLSMLQRQLISLAFATLLFTVPLSAAEKGIARTGLNRVALVVGNSD